MRKCFAFLSLCFALTACTNDDPPTDPTTDCIDLKKGLIAYYPFSGNANDSSGNQKNGELINGTRFGTDAKNKPNNAAEFDGIDDYIRVTDQTNYFAPEKMTVSFMFNLRDVTKRSSFFVKANFNSPSGVSWGSGITLTNQSVFDFTVADPTENCNSIWAYNPSSVLKSTVPLINNSWYHIAVIYNYGVEMIYVNGTLNSAKVNPYTYLKKCPSADFRIGGWWQNDIISINGKVDELRLYNRILCEEEIQKLAREIL